MSRARQEICRYAADNHAACEAFAAKAWAVAAPRNGWGLSSEWGAIAEFGKSMWTISAAALLIDGRDDPDDLARNVGWAYGGLAPAPKGLPDLGRARGGGGARGHAGGVLSLRRAFATIRNYFAPMSAAATFAPGEDAIEFLIDDYWEPGDVRPGYSGPPRADDRDRADVLGDPDLDFAPAFGRIMAILTAGVKQGFPLRPARIHFSGRAAYHAWSPFIANHPVEMAGVCTPHRAGATRLVFHGCAGIEVKRFPVAPTTLTVGGLHLEGLAVEYVGPNTEAVDRHGINLERVSSLRRFVVRGFPGHGVHIVANALAAPENGNASMATLEMGTVRDCGLSGVFISGGDANVCVVRGVNSMVNGRRRVDDDGFGFYDASKLGNRYESCHTRNNHIAGYRATGNGGAPSRARFDDCYTEHSAEYVVAHDQEGPALLDGNAMVITAMGEGSLVDAKGGASVLYTAQNRFVAKKVFEIAGANGASSIFGDATARADGDVSAARQFGLFESKAYGAYGALLSRLFFVHDPLTKVFGFKLHSPAAQPSALGVTDGKHARPGLAVAPRGILVGAQAAAPPSPTSAGSGPRLLGLYDPKAEAALPTAFPDALPGDRLYNLSPNAGEFAFEGWVYAYESTGVSTVGPRRWVRFGPLPAAEPPAPAPPVP